MALPLLIALVYFELLSYPVAFIVWNYQQFVMCNVYVVMSKFFVSFNHLGQGHQLNQKCMKLLKVSPGLCANNR